MAVYDQISGIIKQSGLIPQVRTRLMNQPPDAKLYNGFVDCVIKIGKEAGPLGFYACFIPIWARFAPTTCLQFIFFGQLKPVFGVKH